MKGWQLALPRNAHMCHQIEFDKKDKNILNIKLIFNMDSSGQKIHYFVEEKKKGLAILFSKIFAVT